MSKIKKNKAKLDLMLRLGRQGVSRYKYKSRHFSLRPATNTFRNMVRRMRQTQWEVSKNVLATAPNIVHSITAKMYEGSALGVEPVCIVGGHGTEYSHYTSLALQKKFHGTPIICVTNLSGKLI